MADPFGISFSPSEQQGPNGQPVGGQRPSPIQQAIQTLSLRIPRVAGASAFTAQPLLTSAGGSGLGDPNSAAVLEQLRRMLFGSPAGMSQGPTAPSMPMGGGSGQDPFAALAQALGLSQQGPTSGSGAPMGGSGSGAPLPTGGGVPPPNVFPGSDLPRSPEPPMPPPAPAPMAQPSQPEPDYSNRDTRYI